MEISYLKHFYYVAKYGGFTKASKELLVQQPTMSKSVSALEERLGVQLLVREKRSCYLTDIGQEVYKKCQKIFKEVDSIEELIKNEKDLCYGSLMFCASDAISSLIVPKVHKAFLDKFPAVTPTCFSSSANILLDKINCGEYEFGLFFHTPVIDSKFRVERVLSIPFDLVIKASERKNINVINSFIGSREIDDKKTQAFPALSLLKKDYKDARIIISSNNISSHRNMVLEGLGVSILPQMMIEQDLKAKTIKRLYPKGTFNYSIKLIVKKDHLLSRNAKKWIETLNSITI